VLTEFVVAYFWAVEEKSSPVGVPISSALPRFVEDLATLAADYRLPIGLGDPMVEGNDSVLV
jgi:hypothetical protein